MRTLLRILIIGMTATLGLTAMAQAPYTLIVQGTIAGCTPFQQITVSTTGNTQPLVSHTLEVFPPNCAYDTVIDVYSPFASVLVSTLCNGMVVTAYDSVAFNFIGDTAVMTIDLNCAGGGTPDCLGVINGPNVPGTPCNDGDPMTINDTWDPNCTCVGTVPQNCQAAFTISNSSPWVMDLTNTSTGMAPMLYDWYLPDGSSTSQTSPFFFFTAPGTYGVCLTIVAANMCTSTTCDTVFVDSVGNVTTTPSYYDCMGYPNGTNLPGTPCQIPGTILFGTWNANCMCDTTTLNVYDCTGILNGPNMPGTACVDTVGGVLVPGTWQANCMCVTNTLNDCLGIFNGPNQPGTPCNDGDPNTINDLWSPNCVCIGVTPPPSSVLVTGTVSPCNGMPYPVHIFTDLGTNPYIDTLITTDTNCVYTFLFNPINTSGWVNVEVSCDNGLTWMWDSLGFTSTPGDTLVIDFTCGGLITDCLGIPGGPNMPGTACNDGDTLTVQDTWTPTCQCVGVPVNYYDCLQVLNGPDLPGTPCDDNDPLTVNDTWDVNCLCVGTSTVPCNADFWVLQGFTVDSITNLPVPIPNELWIWNLSSGGTGAFSFLWNFGDGTSSTDPFPTHYYANGGPYLLCLTINDSAGCTSTHCDSVSVDANGMYTGIMAGGNDRQSGFTINVRDPLATGIQDPSIAPGELAVWPNPVQDMLNMAMVGGMRGSITVDMLDLNGRLVRSERHSVSGQRHRMTLNTTGLHAGLYFLRISDGRSTISQRFVKTD
jgi:hypothetical protein